MTDPAAQIIAYMDEHGCSANKAANTLGLERRDATEARKRRKASRARAGEERGAVVELAAPPQAFDPLTATPLEFWAHETRECLEVSEEAKANAAWTACSTFRRLAQDAYREVAAIRASMPAPKPSQTDAELLEEIAALEASLPAKLRGAG